MNDAKALDSIDISRLMELLPHRYPFLMIDRIVDIDGDESAVGVKNVTFNEPHFTGHFPAMPVMPGVLIIEAMAQTAGAICLHKMDRGEPAIVFFMTVDGAKFRKPVVPGDRLELHVRKLKQRGGIFRYAGEAIVDGVKVAEAEVQAMVSFATDAAKTAG
ncbi:MAG: 3-hydroxyacyl-ACP dehydratase FabZ [Rhizobiaceae bacterium]|nr:3-hydroxyacyl-ACP dehydratase FabZ [Rhizobiaceae bacterium]